MLVIRGLEIQPPLVLAPMMDLTGHAFRSLVRAYGGCGLTYSEMLNARRVPREPDAALIFTGFGQESPLVLQLAGCEPDALAAAVRRLEPFQPAGFDLNLGCTRALIMKRGWGAALLKDRQAAQQAVRAMRRATTRCLTAKVRNAWSREEEGRDFLHMLVEEGVDALCVHPRTVEKRFARPARWEWITAVKSWVSVPVIGNGDVRTASDAVAMLRQTGCDGVMIGRAAAARPTIFREAASLLAGEAPIPAPAPQQIFEDLLARFGGTVDAPKRAAELKTFCEYFAAAFPVPHWFWGPLQSLRTSEELVRAVRAFFARSEAKAGTAASG